MYTIVILIPKLQIWEFDVYFISGEDLDAAFLRNLENNWKEDSKVKKRLQEERNDFLNLRKRHQFSES